jgi:hypothetical protein
MRKHIIAAVAAVSALSAISGVSRADEKFDAWTVLKADGRCTAFTKTTSVDGEARPGAFLSIVNVPKEGVKNSVAFSYGKDGAGKLSASGGVDDKSFELLTFDKAAFAGSGAPEAELIAAMKKGGEASVSWTAPDGSVSKDVYSLAGFSTAKAKIDADCR